MQDVPGELTGNHPLKAWLNKLRLAVIARTPQRVPGMELSRTTTGYRLKSKSVAVTGVSTSTNGVFRGIWDIEETYEQYDMVQYLSHQVDAPAFRRSLWMFAWSGPDATPISEFGPVAQLRDGFLYLQPTTNAWFLVSYTAIDDGSELVTNGAAQALLLANYTGQHS